MIYFLLAIVVIAIVVILYLQQSIFGGKPKNERLARMEQASNYKNGAFQNQSETPAVTEGHSFIGVMYDFLFKKSKDAKPSKTIPSIKTDLNDLKGDEDVLIWFGHSSYFMRVNGVTFLIDPVLSGRISPLPGSSQAYKGADDYGVEDIPQVDYLVISHDHYDHLDYKTIKVLEPKISQVICGLGVGAHFERWGYAAEKITEKNWFEKVELKNNMTLHTLPARHFSGRTFKRNTTLWQSYLLETSSKKIFLGGDSGYDEHFKKIGERFGPIDLAIMENGQYNEAWHAIHCLPPETVQAALDLKAKRMMPVHSSKFTLALHPWYEPLEEVSKLAEGKIPLVTPLIGAPVYIDDDSQEFTRWWRD